MPMFTKKPVTIEARKWDGTNISEMLQWTEGVASYSVFQGLCINTLEGPLQANPGDWIIKGIKGEFYPCKPDVFSATYEEAAP